MNFFKQFNLKNSIIRLCIIFLVCSFLLGYYVVSFNKGKDITPPELYITSYSPVYTEKPDESKLLDGIRAKDDVDGDVTNSIRVRSIYYQDDSDDVIVTYAAKDQSNNVGMIQRVVTVRSDGEEQ